MPPGQRGRLRRGLRGWHLRTGRRHGKRAPLKRGSKGPVVLGLGLVWVLYCRCGLFGLFGELVGLWIGWLLKLVGVLGWVGSATANVSPKQHREGEKVGRGGFMPLNYLPCIIRSTFLFESSCNHERNPARGNILAKF